MYQQITMDKLMDALSQECCCPILNTIIHQPVITQDGRTYQKTAIENWFKTSSKSPITGLNLKSKLIIPNISFKNLKQKSHEIFTTLLKKNRILQQENQNLKISIKNINIDLTYLRELKQSDQIILKDYIKKLSICQNTINQKTLSIQGMIQNIKSLQESFSQERQKMQSLQKQLQKQRVQSQKNIQKLNKKLETVTSQNKQYIQSIFKLINNSQTTIQNVNHVLTKIMLKIFEDIESNQKIEKLEEQIQNELHQYKLQIYDSFKFMAMNLSKNKEMHDSRLMITPKLYTIADMKFISVQRVMTIKPFLKLVENLKNDPNYMDYYDRFRLGLNGIQAHKDYTTDYQWQQIVQLAEQYPNIRSIVINYSDLTKIRKSDLQKFKKLQFLSLKAHTLDEESIQEMNEFCRQNPVVVMHSKGNNQVMI